MLGDELCDRLDVRRHTRRPGRHRAREHIAKRRHHPADTLRRLHEVPRRKHTIPKQIDYVAVDVGARRFHHVKGKRRARWSVEVDDPKSRVKADRSTRDRRLRLQDGVEVVEDRVRRVGRRSPDPHASP